MLKWLFAMLDFRLYQLTGTGWGSFLGGGQPVTTGEWVNTGEGGREWRETGGGGTGFLPAPAPAPAPEPVDTGPDFAANRQTADIDRTSRYTHGSYVSALEGIEQQSRASGAAMTPGANDYELPDTAFGERLY